MPPIHTRQTYSSAKTFSDNYCCNQCQYLEIEPVFLFITLLCPLLKPPVYQSVPPTCPHVPCQCLPNTTLVSVYPQLDISTACKLQASGWKVARVSSSREWELLSPWRPHGQIESWRLICTLTSSRPAEQTTDLVTLEFLTRKASQLLPSQRNTGWVYGGSVLVKETVWYLVLLFSGTWTDGTARPCPSMGHLSLSACWMLCHCFERLSDPRSELIHKWEQSH